jgi:pimeloyl-ACP methyl ester carboxylesterase
VTGQGWPKALAPLRPRTLLWQLAVLVVAELLLYLSYGAHAAEFHWATHFLVGLTVAALWWIAFLLVAARPIRLQLLSILGFHLWAMWPDLVFRTPGIPHHQWMDWLALGHISSHHIPGGDTTWLLIALLAAGTYAALLWRWLAMRHAEAAAGMAPAFGVGGAAIIRSQGDPQQVVMAHESLAPTDAQGDPVVMLHGLDTASSAWLPVARLLEDAGREAIVPDLLGFGSSMRIGTVFGLREQVAALQRLLDAHDVDHAHLVGHGWGCTVAAALAQAAPQRVSRMTLVTPGVFADVDSAKRRLAERSALARMTLEGPPLGGFRCGAMCLTRPLIGRLLARGGPEVPPQTTRDGMKHSFAAYRDALMSMVEHEALTGVLRHPPCPTTVVLADDDRTVPASDVLDLAPPADVRIVRAPGDHGVAHDQLHLVADLLLEGIAPRDPMRGAARARR